MENKEIMEYKNIRFELKEDFGKDGKEFQIVNGVSGYGFLGVKNSPVFNTYNVYVDNKLKAIVVNGGTKINVFECADDDNGGFGRIFASEKEMGSEELFEGIYRFMNSWKDRKVEVFGEVINKEDRINYGVKNEQDFMYLLANENERKVYHKWIDKLLTYGVKEGRFEGYSFATFSEYMKKDLDIETIVGMIRGAFKESEIVGKSEVLVSDIDGGVYLNYNDAEDFFEEIDEKVKAREQETFKG